MAFHHLEKMVRLGVVEQDQLGNYVIVKKVDPGILQAFVNVGRFSLPRVGFYAVFFTTIAVAYLDLESQLPRRLRADRDVRRRRGLLVRAGQDMEEEAVLDDADLSGTGEDLAMNAGRSLAGAASGLLLAAILVAGVSIAGGGSLHLDLVKASVDQHRASSGASDPEPLPRGSRHSPADRVSRRPGRLAASGPRPYLFRRQP